MNIFIILMFLPTLLFAHPTFFPAIPRDDDAYQTNAAALCATAHSTLHYLQNGSRYDPVAIHNHNALNIPLSKIKATLKFICLHQQQINDPVFLKKHFRFIRWYPDKEQTKKLAAQKPLLHNLPKQQILMTKYYVHRALASTKPHGIKVYPLYGLPSDEQHLTLEQANALPHLVRFRYGKQAILHGALAHEDIPVLGYVSREDLEAALLQGTIVADFGKPVGKKIFNVHRGNNIPYDKKRTPYAQERYWYFKQVNGIKGYGKDAEHKITVEPTTTFAADLAHFGLGQLLLIQYKNKARNSVSRLGVIADTGGAFVNNLYQVDYLAGSYFGAQAYRHATADLPDYVDAYFMVLK